MTSPLKSRVWSVAWRVGLSAALLGVVAAQLAKSWNDLRAHPPSITWGWAALSFAALMLFLVICSQAWRWWVMALGEKVGARDAFRLMFSANLAKYLPGGIWGVVGQVALCQREGMSALPVTLSMLLDMACQLGGASLVMLPTLSVLIGEPSHEAGAFMSPARLGLLLLAAAALVLGMHPRIMNFALSIAQKVSKRPLPRITVRYRFILTMLAVYTLNWALLAVAFAALGQAILQTPLASVQVLALMGAFIISWNIGVFAFFLPAGLGVREVTLVVLLGSLFPPAWPATLALVARLWILGAEVLAFGIAMLLRRSSPAQVALPEEG